MRGAPVRMDTVVHCASSIACTQARSVAKLSRMPGSSAVSMFRFSAHAPRCPGAFGVYLLELSEDDSGVDLRLCVT